MGGVVGRVVGGTVGACMLLHHGMIAASSWQPVPGAKRRDPPLAAYRRRRLRRLDTRRLHDATGMGAEVKDKSGCEGKKQDVRSSLAPITSRFLPCMATHSPASALWWAARSAEPLIPACTDKRS